MVVEAGSCLSPAEKNEFSCTLSIINCNVNAAVRASFEYALFSAQMRCEFRRASNNLEKCGDTACPAFPGEEERISTDSSRQITIEANKKSCAVSDETIHLFSYNRPCGPDVAVCNSVCRASTSRAALIHALLLNSRCGSLRSVFR